MKILNFYISMAYKTLSVIKRINSYFYLFSMYYVKYPRMFTFILWLVCMVFTTDYVLCDDGVSPDTRGYESNVNPGVSHISELDGNSVRYGFNQDIRPRIQGPSNYPPYGYDFASGRIASDGMVNPESVQYQPYRPGLQATSEGYRYEMVGAGNPESVQYQPYRPGLHATSEGYRYEFVGDYTQQKRVAFNLNINSSETSDTSTQLGLIEPTRSEVINNSYYYAEWRRNTPYDTSESSLKRRVYNKIKTTVSNHIAKSNEAALNESRYQTENFIKNTRHLRYAESVRKVDRYNSMLRR
jgi:hypothetical protein